MLYATGGLAFTRHDFSLTQPGFSAGKDDVLFGYAIGGGLETKLAPAVSARIEALHYGFGDKTVDTARGLAAYDVDQTVIRAGLSFHFD